MTWAPHLNTFTLGLSLDHFNKLPDPLREFLIDRCLQMDLRKGDLVGLDFGMDSIRDINTMSRQLIDLPVPFNLFFEPGVSK